jgi:lipoprotein-anchoring transpeptidase ErfK/SrfK
VNSEWTEVTSFTHNPSEKKLLQKPLLLLAPALLCAFSFAADKTATAGKTADRIVIEKSAHTMKLMSGGHVLKTYKVAKQQEGDRETPEGEYVIDSKNECPSHLVSQCRRT